MRASLHRPSLGLLVAFLPMAGGCASVPFATEGIGGSLFSYTYKDKDSVDVFTDLYVDANTSWNPTVPVAAGFPASFAASIEPDEPAWTPRRLQILAPPRRVEMGERGAFTRVDVRVPSRGKARLDLGTLRMPVRVRHPDHWTLVPALVGPSEIVGDTLLRASWPAHGGHLRVLAGNRASVGVSIRDSKDRPLGWAGRCTFSSSDAALSFTPHERCATTLQAPEAGTAQVGVSVTWQPYAFGPDAPNITGIDLHASTAEWQVTAVPASSVASLMATSLARDSGGIFALFVPPVPPTAPDAPPVEPPPEPEGAIYRLHAATSDGATVELSDVSCTAQAARVFEWNATLELYQRLVAETEALEKQLPEGAPKPDGGAMFLERLGARFPDPRTAVGGNVVLVILDRPNQPATVTCTAAGRSTSFTVK